jgi:hypothetical protein
MKRKAQSALEYMMTYGWAILIIVIVAAVLYSMGIFSPSSSTGPTVTGFTPFTVSGQTCNSSGLFLSVVLGGLPSGATTATITQAVLTPNTGISAAGTAKGIFTANTVVATAAAGVGWFQGADCTLNSHYSASIVINYTYTNGGLGSTQGTARGTVSGTGT